ncbi:MAG TPA: phage holin family protein [Micrococcaceae bacterium]|nr:phage holin family protein [Micrococcaceae bacterium]
MSSSRYAKTGPRARGTAADGSSLLDTSKVTLRLVLKQLNDEISLAKVELKRKGVQLGIAAGILTVALLFLGLVVVALIVAAIMALALVMPAWLAALLIAAFFLLLFLILGLVGALRLKKTMPLIPQAAWFGIRYDLGIAKEGTGFDVRTLAAQPTTKAEAKAAKAQKELKAERAKEAKDAKAAQNGPAPTEAQLLARTKDRRQHLLSLRTQLVARADVRQQVRAFVSSARGTARHAAADARGRFGSQAASAGEVLDSARERWVPLTVLAVSGTALLILLRKLLKK